MTPFEIRLELLKMARDLLSESFHRECDRLNNDWCNRVETARNTGQVPPEHPGNPAFPTEAEIIEKAQTLNNFVSQIPLDTKTSTKK